MASNTLQRGSLVLYKGKPAIVAGAGQKLELMLQDGQPVSVRPKDVTLLHRGPADFAALRAPAVRQAVAAVIEAYLAQQEECRSAPPPDDAEEH